MPKKIVLNPVKVFDRDTVQHLRIPFSFYLLPVFCFGFSQASSIDWFNFGVILIVLHLLVYPGSNVYNSYMDRDTGSIGGLEKPPPVTDNLYYASIFLDAAGLFLAMLAGWELALIILPYIAVSKAYSWHRIRLKKYPFASWIVVALFQGGYTFMMVNMCVTVNYTGYWFDGRNITCFVIASLLVGAFYPLTQVYQHDEDGRRGDRTLSLILGVKGTFAFSASLFVGAAALVLFYMIKYYYLLHFWVFALCLLPVATYFVWWFTRVLRDPAEANFANTMRINKISAYCMIACFCILAWLNAGFYR